MSTVLSVEKSLKEIKTDLHSKFNDVMSEISKKEVELARIQKEIDERKKAIAKTTDFVVANLNANINKEQFAKYLEKPYVSKGIGKNKILVFVPKWYSDAFNFQVGWLVDTIDEHYVFELNQYSNWFGDIPDDLSKTIEWPEGINAIVENDTISFDPHDKNSIKHHLGKFLKDFTDNQATITRGHSFEILAKIIESGRIPFGKHPVKQSDLTNSRKLIKLLPHQVEARKYFRETGAIGVFLPTGGGKSFIAMDAMEDLKGKHLLVTYGTSLVEQWKWYIETYIPHRKDDITVIHYQSAYNVTDEFTLTVFDEAHRLPAPTFSRFSTIKTKYRMGLSASPFREDGNEKYIVALTGFPWGTNWAKYMLAVGQRFHPVIVHVVEKELSKMKVVRKLFNPKFKTMLYSDNLALGYKCASMLSIPSVNGESPNRTEEIQKFRDNVYRQMMFSRIADMGLSFPDLQRIIEIDFQFGSRQQELQRTGRLMHSQAENKKHDIIMTRQEFNEYGKRLWILREKGFDLKFVDEDVKK